MDIMVRVIPIEIIAAWPPSNFDDPSTRGSGLIVLTGVLLAVVTLFVLLRLYVRISMLKWVGADDIFMLLPFVGGLEVLVLDAATDQTL